MRFLMLGFRRRSSADKHQRRPARIDSPGTDFVTTAKAEDDAEIEALLRELGEEPFDVWARLYTPGPAPEREPSVRVRRAGKPRMGIRRRATGC
jgi:hypothetical protein